jgi:hypothetical protein
MSGNWCALAICLILVDVVPRTMANERAASTGEFTDELTSFQVA